MSALRSNKRSRFGWMGVEGVRNRCGQTFVLMYEQNEWQGTFLQNRMLQARPPVLTDPDRRRGYPGLLVLPCHKAAIAITTQSRRPESSIFKDFWTSRILTLAPKLHLGAQLQRKLCFRFSSRTHPLVPGFHPETHRRPKPRFETPVFPLRRRGTEGDCYSMTM